MAREDNNSEYTGPTPNGEDWVDSSSDSGVDEQAYQDRLVEGSKSRGEKIGDTSSKATSAAGSSAGKISESLDRAGKSLTSGLGGVKSAANSKIDEAAAEGNKAAQATKKARDFSNNVKETAEKVAKTGQAVAEHAKNIGAAATKFVASLFNPWTWIIIAAVLIVSFIILSTMTAVQVYGKNTPDCDSAQSNGGAAIGWPGDDAAAEEKRDAIMSWFMTTDFELTGGKPFNKNQAAGAVGNLQIESGFTPYIVYGHASGKEKWSNSKVKSWKADENHAAGVYRPIGLVQWTLGRSDKLISNAEAKGTEWHDIQVQLDFIKEEIDGAYKSKLSSAGFSDTSKSPSEYAEIWEAQYEVAGHAIAERKSGAETAAKEYSGGGGSSSGSNYADCGNAGASVGAHCYPIPGKSGFCYPMDPEIHDWVLTTYAGHCASCRDIAGPEGTPVHAVAAGTVVFSGDSGFSCQYGGPPQYEVHVKLDQPYGDSDMTRYVHLKEPSTLKEGDKLAGGDGIGLLGTTGCSTGPHLHFDFGHNSSNNTPELLGESF